MNSLILGIPHEPSPDGLPPVPKLPKDFFNFPTRPFLNEEDDDNDADLFDYPRDMVIGPFSTSTPTAAGKLLKSTSRRHAPKPRKQPWKSHYQRSSEKTTPIDPSTTSPSELLEHLRDKSSPRNSSEDDAEFFQLPSRPQNPMSGTFDTSLHNGRYLNSPLSSSSSSSASDTSYATPSTISTSDSFSAHHSTRRWGALPLSTTRTRRLPVADHWSSNESLATPDFRPHDTTRADSPTQKLCPRMQLTPAPATDESRSIRSHMISSQQPKQVKQVKQVEQVKQVKTTRSLWQLSTPQTRSKERLLQIPGRLVRQVSMGANLRLPIGNNGKRSPIPTQDSLSRTGSLRNAQ